MAMKINFDVAHTPEEPTFVLAKKNGDKLGKINAFDIEVVGSLNDASEISFTVYKELNGVKDYLWDEIVDFKLVYCVEWDKWFEITVELDESAETKKTVSGTSLGQAELSQIMLFGIEINTETDIERDAYEIPTVLFNETNPEASLLHRIMEKAPHYSIAHVDHTIAKIQRTFTFDDKSLYDSFQEIAEEIDCLFVFNSNSDSDGNIQRTISVYDLESNCLDCNYRGEFTMVCPECGSKNIDEGYGNDTGIFVTADELAEDIQFSTDTDKVKNCFRLEAGDDLMTSTIRNCNPNGSAYIWHITDTTKKDMSKELVDKIAAYDKTYAEYYKSKEYYSCFGTDAATTITAYNNLVDKYNKLDSEFEDDEKISKIPSSIVGYKNLMKIYYDTIDFSLYLKSSLMPNTALSDTKASTEAAKLTSLNLSPVATTSVSGLSVYTAQSLVLAMAKVLVDNRYKVEVKNSSLSGTAWTGNFTVTNYSNEDDTAESPTATISITTDEKEYIQQKLKKSLAKGDSEDVSVTGLFDKDLTEFTAALKKYSLARLTSFHDACQACIDILVEQGVSDKETWSTNTTGENLYDNLYTPYLNKLRALETEMNTRGNEVSTIVGEYDKKGNVTKKGIQNYIEDIISDVQEALDFEDYLGKELWHEMCSFRREDKYSNDNYISDSLNNAEIIDKANEFIEEANKEIYKSSELQHSIKADLNNLLVIEKFKPIVDDFEVGNWIRVMVDDELYKLRLVEYTIDYSSLDKLSVEFSDVANVNSTIKSVQGILDQASSMATSYDSVKRQASQGNSSKDQLNEWVNRGLSLTNMKIVGNADNQNVTWDSHGILCKEYLPIQDAYDDKQLKIINKGLYVTDDNWETARAGIGNFMYYDPSDKEKPYKEGYGVIADTLIGNLILSKRVGIYNEENSITLDEKGLTITVEDDAAETKTKTAFTIQKKLENNKIESLMYVDSEGNLVLNGSLKVESKSGNTTTTTTLEGLGQTASNYLTYENGVLKVGKTGNGYVGIDSSGTSIYNSTSIQLARFDGTGVKFNDNNGNILAQFDGNGIKLNDGGGNSVASFTKNSIVLGGSNTTSVTMAGNATLNVASLNIGGTGVINSKNDLKGDKGEDGSDGRDGVDITSQYVYYNSSYGLAITPFANSTSGKHLQLKSDGIYFKNGTTTTASFTNSSISLGTDDTTIYLSDGSINTWDAGSSSDSPMRIMRNNGCGIFIYKSNESGLGIQFVDKNSNPCFISAKSLDLTGHIDSAGYITATANITGEDVIAEGRLRTNGAATGTGTAAVLYKGYIRESSGSSKRYKTQIAELSDESLKPEKLYDLPIKQYKFKDGYLAEDDEYEDRTVIGFIAEDVADIYPIAAYHNDNGEVENWDARYIVPPMLKLVQDQKERIDELVAKIDKLTLTQ